MFLKLKRKEIRLNHDVKRVLLRYLNFGSDARILPVFHYIEQLSENEVEASLSQLLQLYQHRHFDCIQQWSDNYNRLGASFNNDDWTHNRKCLLGAYFTMEYSIESAALFNPSIVLLGKPNAASKVDFIMSARSTGEGHISSISFIKGTVDRVGNITLHPRDRKITTGRITRLDHEEDYDVTFSPDIPINSRVLFPCSPGESNGMEDVRLVRFDRGDEEPLYIGTYTAYNGRQIIPKMISTRDFLHFEIRRLKGDVVKDKGMALFPEKINNQFFMTGRQDGRHSTLMASDKLDEWNTYSLLTKLKYPWEIIQMGNCGSPIKTERGWLLLTHAVGPMRRYVISAVLLDLHNPGKIIAHLDQPLLQPEESEREGYVPNVLYTCGATALGNTLIIPYAMSDSTIGFATANIDELIDKMVPNA